MDDRITMAIIRAAGAGDEGAKGYIKDAISEAHEADPWATGEILHRLGTCPLCDGDGRREVFPSCAHPNQPDPGPVVLGYCELHPDHDKEGE